MSLAMIITDQMVEAGARALLNIPRMGIQSLKWEAALAVAP